MNAFISDLDNTLIYSFKKDIGRDKINVEIYQERQISFMTRRSYEALFKLTHSLYFIPLTTRSLEQYKRIDFGKIKPRYALTANGGMLLIDGIEDKKFTEESLSLTEPAFSELQKARNILKQDKNLTLDVRLIDGLFLFSKSDMPSVSLDRLREEIDLAKVNLFQNGEKIYVIPRKLNKGTAVIRIKKYLNLDKVIAAGDSSFDIPMLEAADISFSPLHLNYTKKGNVQCFLSEQGTVFSDFIFDHIVDLMK